ncbi:type IV pili methyl-accepting chemotaxis transducer N-terminal domain-containing protein [Tautonia sociabilis]|nr:type IV pili methyl-accepting chemotaxis transducer N-terminal domain-containing protein [Tautonia sociabilis]
MATERLTKRYVAALGVFSLLALLFGTLLTVELDRRERDARVINVAGRQRMLSQKLCKAAWAASSAVEDARLLDNLDELGYTAAEWESAHAGLRRGDPARGLPGNNSPEVERLFRELEPDHRAMLGAARRLVAAGRRVPPDRREMTRAVGTLMSHEGAFLRTMDTIVGRYDREARTSLARIQQSEWAVSISFLIV